MLIESMLTSKEVSLKLKEAGVEQESRNWWVKSSYEDEEGMTVWQLDEKWNLLDRKPEKYDMTNCEKFEEIKDTFDFADHTQAIEKGEIERSKIEFYSAYLISELLEMVSNDVLNCYFQDKEKEFDTQNKIFDLFRSPDKLAEVVLYKLNKSRGLNK